jgi:hypothetical protein
MDTCAWLGDSRAILQAVWVARPALHETRRRREGVTPSPALPVPSPAAPYAAAPTVRHLPCSLLHATRHSSR